MFICLIFLLASSFTYGQGVLISEVYAHGLGSSTDHGQEWFELFNAGEMPVKLNGMVVRRLDGSSSEEAFRLTIQSNEDLIIEPGDYFVVAQSRDLGLPLCLDIPLVVVHDRAFSLDNSGVQSLCIQPVGQVEDCAQFSNSRSFPKGHSRYYSGSNLVGNDKLISWQVEDCPLFFGRYGTPGKAASSCRQEPFPYDSLIMYCPWNLNLLGQGPALSFPRTKSWVQPGKYEVVYEKLPNHFIAFQIPEEVMLLNERKVIELFYTTEPKVNFGSRIHFVLDNENKNRLLWDYSEVLSGHYYIFARIGDGVGNFSVSELMGPVEIKKDQVEHDFSIISAAFDVVKQAIIIRWQCPLGHGRASFYWLDSEGSEHLITLSATSMSHKNELLWRPMIQKKAIAKIMGKFHHPGGIMKSLLSVQF